MILEAVDLTTAPFIFDPEQAFKTAGKINETESNPNRKVGIELYPIPKRPPQSIIYPKMPVTTERVIKWQNENDAKAIRVHLPYMYNWREIAYELVAGDWYGSVGDHGGFKGYLKNRMREAAAMLVMGPATSGHGLQMAHDLGIGVNSHPNTSAGYFAEDKIDWFKSQAAFVLAENSVSFNSLYQRDRVVLDDFRATIRHDVVGYGFRGGLDALDHKFLLIKTSDPVFINQKVDEIIEMLNDPMVQEYTEAMHISSPGHGLITRGYPPMERMLTHIGQTPFHRPIRIALDIDPSEVKRMSEDQILDYVLGTREWIFETVQKSS